VSDTGTQAASEDEPPPVAGLFADVVGQRRAVSQLRAAARRPVHAYLLHGPPGSGMAAGALAFAAALICPDGGCGRCNHCRRVLAGIHPDLLEVERTGAQLEMDEARAVTARAQRRPLEVERQVLVLHDVHLAERAAPALRKTTEEPPASTVFVLTATDLPPQLATIASRCVRIRFDVVPTAAVEAWLVADGVPPDRAATVAAAARGRLDRAQVLAADHGFLARLERWRTAPTALDGTGAAAAQLAAELLALADEGLEPLRNRQAAELETLAAQAEEAGARGIAGRRQIEDRHRREERRWRADDLRAGLATLAGAERDRLVAHVTTPSATGGPAPSHGDAAEEIRLVRHLGAIDAAAAALDRNVNEGLLMEALLVDLSDLAD
jgi:DNA polymerase III subunit delta'